MEAFQPQSTPLLRSCALSKIDIRRPGNASKTSVNEVNILKLLLSFLFRIRLRRTPIPREDSENRDDSVIVHPP
jgi:hypothetical protein